MFTGVRNVSREHR